MVRLVFRPYARVGRSICTSESLRASTGVSPGFALPRRSSPSFGSRHARSRSAPPTTRRGTGWRCARGLSARKSPARSRLGRPTPPSLSLRLRVSWNPATRARVGLLGPCFKTGREDSRPRSPPTLSGREPRTPPKRRTRPPQVPRSSLDPEPGSLTELASSQGRSPSSPTGPTNRFEVGRGPGPGGVRPRAAAIRRVDRQPPGRNPSDKRIAAPRRDRPKTDPPGPFASVPPVYP